VERLIRQVCVFCGSSAGLDPEFTRQARELGKGLARRGLGMVYGGGRRGLMGQAADAALEAGGRVTGVIPRALVDLELAHTGLSSLEVVSSMHERKARMAALSDAFIALPGGYGTLEEFFEVITWAQLGLHAKPLALLNTAGYYDGLLGFMEKAVDQGFIGPDNTVFFLVRGEPESLLDALLESPARESARKLGEADI
jgi:uncharacterized protein (TIGR00730 family)